MQRPAPGKALAVMRLPPQPVTLLHSTELQTLAPIYGVLAALQVMVQGGAHTGHQLRRLGRALEYASDKNAVIADLKHTLSKTSKRMALMDVSTHVIQGLVQYMCTACVCIVMPSNAQWATAACHSPSGQCASDPSTHWQHCQGSSVCCRPCMRS